MPDSTEPTNFPNAGTPPTVEGISTPDPDPATQATDVLDAERKGINDTVAGATEALADNPDLELEGEDPDDFDPEFEEDEGDMEDDDSNLPPGNDTLFA